MPWGAIPGAWDELRVEATALSKKTKVLAGEKVVIGSREVNEKCFVEHTDVGEGGVDKPLSQELEISVLILILCRTIYGRIREPSIAALGGREVSNSTFHL